MPAHDALLHTPGTFEIVLQELEVVIGLQDQDVRSSDALNDKLGGMAEVRQEPNVGGCRPKQETDRILGVVRHRERINVHVADFEAGPRAKETAVEPQLELMLDGILGQPIAIDRDLKFCAKAHQTLDMIGVLVS